MAQKITLADLSYDPETGFVVDQRTGRRVGHQPKPNSKSPRYRQIRISGVLHYEQAVAWRLQTGEWPPDEIEVDHRDGDGFNNRWLNLRLGTHTQNAQGFRRKSAGKSSRFRGVSFCKSTGRWQAHIKIDRKSRRLGRFDTEEAAADAYRAAAKQEFGDFARHA